MTNYSWVKWAVCAAVPSLAACLDFDSFIAKGNTPVVSGAPSPQRGPTSAPTSADMPMVCLSGENFTPITTVTVGGTQAYEVTASDGGTQLCFRLPMRKGMAGPANIVVANNLQNPVEVQGFSYYLGTLRFLPKPVSGLTLSAAPDFLVRGRYSTQFETGATVTTDSLVFVTNATTSPTPPALETWTLIDPETFSVFPSALAINGSISAAAVGDFDGVPGTQELALGTDSSLNANLYFLSWNLTDFQFTPGAGSGQRLAGGIPNQLQAANLDGSGADELLVGYRATNQVTVLRQGAGGVFAPDPVTLNTTNPLLFVLGADFNGDGNVDILTGEKTQVTSYASNGGVPLQLGAATPALNLNGFTLSEEIQLPTRLGPPAAWLAPLERGTYLITAGVNQGQAALAIWPPAAQPGTFGVAATAAVSAQPTEAPLAAALVDVNLDGKLDVVALTGAHAVLLLQDPAVSEVAWAPPQMLPDTGCQTRMNLVATLDVNRDQLNDLVVTCENSTTVSMLINASE